MYNINYIYILLIYNISICMCVRVRSMYAYLLPGFVLTVTIVYCPQAPVGLQSIMLLCDWLHTLTWLILHGRALSYISSLRNQILPLSTLHQLLRSIDVVSGAAPICLVSVKAAILRVLFLDFCTFDSLWDLRKLLESVCKFYLDLGRSVGKCRTWSYSFLFSVYKHKLVTISRCT